MKYAPQFTDGLGRLVRGGAFFTNAMLDYENTETAPGHATGMSGRFPRSTGIVSNSRGVYDPQAPVIGNTTMFASPFRFRGGDAHRLAAHQGRALARALRVAEGPRRDPADGPRAPERVLVGSGERPFHDEQLLRRHAADVAHRVQRAPHPGDLRRHVVEAAAPGFGVRRKQTASCTRTSATRLPLPAPAAGGHGGGGPRADRHAGDGRAHAAGGAARPEAAQPRRRGVDRCRRDLALDDRRGGPPLRPRLARGARPDPAARPRARRLLRFALRGARFHAHRDRAHRRTTAWRRSRSCTRRRRTTWHSAWTSRASRSGISRRSSRRRGGREGLRLRGGDALGAARVAASARGVNVDSLEKAFAAEVRATAGSRAGGPPRRPREGQRRRTRSRAAGCTPCRRIIRSSWW